MSFSKLTNLKDLNLDWNHFEEFPTCIAHLDSLQDLSIQHQHEAGSDGKDRLVLVTWSQDLPCDLLRLQHLDCITVDWQDDEGRTPLTIRMLQQQNDVIVQQSDPCSNRAAAHMQKLDSIGFEF